MGRLLLPLHRLELGRICVLEGRRRRKAVFWRLGLPFTIRLPTLGSGSTASSVLVIGGANTVGPSCGAPTSAAAPAAAAFSVIGNNNNAIDDNRLFVDSSLNNPTTSPTPPLSSKRLLSRPLSPSYILLRKVIREMVKRDLMADVWVGTRL